MIQSDRLNIMLNTDLGRKIFVYYIIEIPVPTVIQMLMNLFHRHKYEFMIVPYFNVTDC